MKTLLPSAARHGLEAARGRLTQVVSLSGHFLGVRRSALVEIAVFLAAAIAFDILAGAGERFELVNPHPFWAIVLLIAAQYGTNEALLAAGIASLALRVGNIPPQSVAQDLYDYWWQLLRLPILWFAAGGMIGELCHRHLRSRAVVERRLKETEARESNIRSAFEKLNKVKQGLETAIASQLHSAVTLYQAAKKVERLDPGAVLDGATSLVKAVMSPSKFSVFIMTNAGLELSLAEGWDADDPFPRAYSPASDLFRRVIGEREILSVACAEDGRLLAGHAMLAGPLVDSESGEALGMLKIERLGFLALNVSSIQSFRSLCAWISEAYAKARRHQAAQSGSVFNLETQLLTHHFWERESAFLTRLARRMRFPLSSVSLRVENSSELTPDQLSRVARSVSNSVAKVLRTTDLVFDSGLANREYTLLLTGTPMENVSVVVNKLIEELETQLGDLAGVARLTTTAQSLYRPPVEGAPTPATPALMTLAHHVQPEVKPGLLPAEEAKYG